MRCAEVERSCGEDLRRGAAVRCAAVETREEVRQLSHLNTSMTLNLHM